MDNVLVWALLFLASVILGTLTYLEAHLKENKGVIYGFMNIFRHTVGYFIASGIGYYFIQIRRTEVIQGGAFTASDLILLVVFIISVLGWLPFYVKSTHDNISSLVSKVFK